MTPSRRLQIALALTGSFMVLEAVVGVLSGSLALISDAGHMLSDTAALGVALFTTSIAGQPADEDHSLGHGRAEVLGAAATAGSLVFLAIWIVIEALSRFGEPHTVDAAEMIPVAALGLALNVAMAALLAKGESLQQRAAWVNVIGDALGSVGAIVAGGLIAWKGWFWADPLVSIFIAVLIVYGASRVLREVVDVLMHAVPEGLQLPRLSDELATVEGVESVHDLHAWSMRPGEDVITVHVVLAADAEAIDTCARVEARVRAHRPQAHITVQPESPEPR
jgi:cobalt-zinc-cadmium efflux system protein